MFAFVGDPKQAIYGWAGSDPDAFEAMPAQQTITLNQSYRVPKAIAEYVRLIFDDVDILPTEVEGAVKKGLIPDLSQPGTHMILCRCNYQLARWKKWLIRTALALGLVLVFFLLHIFRRLFLPAPGFDFR